MEGIILNGLSAIIVFVALALLGDQIKASAPLVAKWFVRTSCHFLPTHLRERYEEEWLSDIENTPGALWKLWVALGCFIAIVPMIRDAQQEKLVSERPTSNRNINWAVFVLSNRARLEKITDRLISLVGVAITLVLLGLTTKSVVAHFEPLNTELSYKPFSDVEASKMADQDLPTVERHKIRFSPWKHRRIQ